MKTLVYLSMILIGFLALAACENDPVADVELQIEASEVPAPDSEDVEENKNER
ncbi:hypothetical protein QQ020_07915 [Fulvivirgaceae bacterium BMA12]|uniref:Lipoprotein n=1 Tax=Agaribacillus aureus TaxID=3051825 RepID=A0ABT8L2M5_9BACT|nr:hypothetical protein [Fulvivirgaceae bacterium BMA12]